MWNSELSSIYENNVLNEDLYSNPKVTRGTIAPQTAGQGLSYKNYKAGLPVNNLGDESQAGNVQFGNPYEQNEEVSVISLIDAELSNLDGNSPTDRVAIDVLGKIKKKLSK
jgi:hypothetical protein